MCCNTNKVIASRLTPPTLVTLRSTLRSSYKTSEVSMHVVCVLSDHGECTFSADCFLRNSIEKLMHDFVSIILWLYTVDRTRIVEDLSNPCVKETVTNWLSFR